MIHPVRMDAAFDFCCPVKLHYGRGAIDRLGEFAEGAGRVLLVTGQASARKSGLLQRARKALAPRAVTVFDGVEPNPSIETVQRGAKLAVESEADLVVGMGGGSAMDAAKAIAAIAPNGGDFRRELGKRRLANPPIRLLAVPTTCGTGSEANHYAIITDARANDKVNFSGPQTYPAAGILDPTVLDSVGRHILVGTALDAFSHALEGYTSRRSQPAAETLALEAMGLILRHLPAAADGDREAKANLLFASALAGIVIAHSGTTMLHAMGYYLTLRHGIPHGKANAILLPALMEHLEVHLHDKLSAVLELLPVGRRDLEAMSRYIEDLGVQTALSAHGVNADEFSAWADYVLTKPNTAATVGVVDKKTLLGLLRARA